MTYKRSVRGRQRRRLKGGMSREQALAFRKKFIAWRNNLAKGGAIMGRGAIADYFKKMARNTAKSHVDSFKKAFRIS